MSVTSNYVYKPNEIIKWTSKNGRWRIGEYRKEDGLKVPFIVKADWFVYFFSFYDLTNGERPLLVHGGHWIPGYVYDKAHSLYWNDQELT